MSGALETQTSSRPSRQPAKNVLRNPAVQKQQRALKGKRAPPPRPRALFSLPSNARRAEPATSAARTES